MATTLTTLQTATPADLSPATLCRHVRAGSIPRAPRLSNAHRRRSESNGKLASCDNTFGVATDVPADDGSAGPR